VFSITKKKANLLDNAVKFTKHGSILIRTKRKKDSDGEEIVVSIEDTGSGITPKILPRLFTKFATASETGTGLGLFICKSIVEAHGGRIWAENNPESKGGAVFELSLPLGEQQQQQSPSSSNLTSGKSVNQ